MCQLQHPEILEVWERADQGHANAYRCSASDGHSYYVKSQGATWRGLACEWVTARLALSLGLPIAPFAQVSFDDAFARGLQRAGNRHLAAGLAFGSRVAPFTREFEPSLVTRCTTQFRRDLVAFDWWVHNADRTLGETAGNPNLLWDTAHEKPVVIDHNMAFDTGFEAGIFMETHIFRADLTAVTTDFFLCADYEQRFSSLLPLLADIWAELPQNWLETDDGDARFLMSDFRLVLDRVSHPNFWPVP